MNSLSSNFKRQTLFFCLAVLLGTGCKDDGMDASPEQTSALDVAVENMNANVRALQTLVEARREGTTVVSFQELSGGTGYSFELSDGTTLTALTDVNAPGAEGEEMYSPILGVTEQNGGFYWTVDGGWLYDEGKRVPASGDGQVTPEIGVSEDGHWDIVLDGRTVRLSRKVSDGRFASVFETITVGTSSVSFTFSDRTAPFALGIEDGGSGHDQPALTGAIRRPVSPSQPMWLVHIDSWVCPDPQKIIDLIPEDIRPYVVFNLSLSVGRDEATGRWNRVEYGYETAKSWLRTCAENRVWAMVQPSSGAYTHLPDCADYAELESSAFGEFFREYPNFLGFNYCEQFWGFGDSSPYAATSEERLEHWANLMKLTHKYGGYLVVSFCNPYWGADMNPVAMFKRNADLADVCRQYPENLIVCEKSTSKHGFFDVESTCLGAWLSGFSGQYGFRFDECGWNPQNGDADFPVAAGAAPVIEHVMLTGQTVLDGPELTWRQCIKESGTTAVGGYTSRRWELFPQFTNVSMDIFRKILDGTIPILSRREVIGRTKVVIVNDVNSGSGHDMYCSPGSLYEGLYLMDGEPFVPAEQNHPLYENTSWFKKTGRYPAIPVVYELADEAAHAFEVQVGKSAYESRWGNEETKVAEFDRLFPEVSEGGLYVGRHRNGLVTYNPSEDSGDFTSIPLEYNTCDRLKLKYAKYTTGVVREYANRLAFYLTNYSADNSMKTEVVEIHGCASKPGWRFTDRGQHAGSDVQESWNAGVLTLTVRHNGPLDLMVDCSGDATGRRTDWLTASVSVPPQPVEYLGALQYEAENFDYKGGVKIVKEGVGGDIRNYAALGYLDFGTGASAAVREEVCVPQEGAYTLRMRYRAPETSVSSVALYVNGGKVTVPTFGKTGGSGGDWNVSVQIVRLNRGKNTVELRAESAPGGHLWIDNFEVVR